MTHHRQHHKRPDTAGPDAIERGYAWMLMALLGAIGVWLLVFSISAPAPRPVEMPKTIVLSPIESPVNEPEAAQIEPATSLPEPEIVAPEAANPVEVKPAKPAHKRLPKLRLAPRATAPSVPWDPSLDPSRYAYWLHIQ